MIFVGLIYNLALLVALSVVSGFIGTRWKNRLGTVMLQGLVFGSAAVIGMLQPVIPDPSQPGLFFDGRSVVISLCGLFFGPVAATVAAGMALVLRICQGGIGATMGSSVILASALLGVCFHYQWMRRDQEVSLWQFWGFGVLVHVGMLLLTFTLPFDKAVETLGKIGLPVILVYPLATVLIGRILSDQVARTRFIMALRDNLEEFRTTLYSIGDAVIGTDQTGRVQHMNQVAEALTGWSEPDALGKPVTEIFQIITAGTRAPVEDPVQRVLRDGKIIGLANHTRLIARNGRECPISDSAAPIRNAAGQLRGVVLIFRDVTREYEAAAALQESEMRFRTVLETVSMAGVMLDAAGNILLINDFLLQLTGWKREEVLGKSWFALFAPVPIHDYLKTEIFLKTISTGDVPAHLENEILTRQGEPRLIAWNNTVIRNHAGTVVGVASIGEDITERRRTEAALRQSEERFALFMDQLPAAAFIKDADGRTLFMNRYMATLFGISEWHGKQTMELLPSEIATQMTENDRQVLAEGAKVFIETVRNGQGAEQVFQTSKFPIPVEHGKPLLGGIAIDISDRKRVEAALRASSEQYRQLAQNLPNTTVFLFDHDLRYTLVEGSLLPQVGIIKEQMAGKSIWEVLPRERAERLAPFYQAALGGVPQQDILSEYDGHAYTTNILPIKDAEGRILGGMVVSQEITERRKSEAALRISEMKYRRLHESLMDAFAATDMAGRIQDCNSAFQTMLGYSDEELRGLTCEDLTPAQWHAFETRIVAEQIIPKGHSEVYEKEYLRRDGTVFPVELRTFLILDEANQPSGMWAIVRDITERKRIEEIQMFLSQGGYQRQEENFFEALARHLAGSLGMGYVCIDRLQSDNLSAQTLAVYNDGRFEANVAYALKDTPCGDVVGKQICCFPRQVCQRFPQDAALQDLQAESYVGTTLWGSSGKPIGLIAVIGRQPLENPHLAETILKLVAVRAAGELERQQVEEALRASEERFRNLVQRVPALAVQGYGMDGITKYWNQASERLYGYTEQEAIGRNLLDLIIPPEMRDYASRAIRQMSETGQPIPAAELSLMRKDGSRVAVFSSHAIVQVPGQPMELFCLDIDITERRQAEAALRESEQRFRTLADSGQALIWTSGLDKKCNYFNQPWLDFTGRTLEQELGDGWTEGVHPDDLARCFEIYSGAFNRRERFSMDYRVRHRDGSWRWIQDDGSPRHDTQGNFIGYIGHCLDISGRKQAEDELQRYREHLEELVQQRTVELAEARDLAQAANRAKSSFLANMSHELRTPLTAVLGFADLMSRDPSIPGRSRDNLAIIIRSGEHLLTLINDILDLSKIEAGRIEVDRRDLDLGELIQDVMNMMRVRAEAKNLQLVLDQSSAFPRFVHSDPGKFRQILVNLIGNAIKFTSAGQVMVRLTASAIPDGHLLAVEVRDTGIGIAPGDMDRIFRPFEQIMTRMTEGSGLGLTITRQYVQMLGGQISVTSELGKGTSFHFTIPVGLVSLDNAQALPVARHPARISSPTADLRLLIVEDQDENRLLLRCFLEPFNFQLREAVNGEEAIAIFQDWHPQLIFMDRRMPVLDGLSATQRIRSLPGGAQTIIVAVSAHSFKEEQQEMLAAGCNGFIAKPFGSADLLALLKQHLHLDFTYTEDEAPEEAARPLSATDLASLSPAALAVLNRLSIVCDESELVKWLESQDGLAPVVKKKLAHLIQEYQFETIQTISAAAQRQAQG